MNFKQFCDRIEARQFPVPFPGNWIHGKWQVSASAKPLPGSVSPNSGQVLIEPTSDRSVLLQALDSAQEALPKLAALPTANRVQVLAQLQQVLTDFEQIVVTTMCLEAGKPRWEAQSDFDAAMQLLRQSIQQGPEVEETLRASAAIGSDYKHLRMTPVGIVIAVVPFSTPITNFVSYFIASMLSGCPIILCPSSHATLNGLLFAFIEDTLEVPPGSLNVVFGNFETFKKALSDRRIEAIIYTGSREHCDAIRRESRSCESRQLVLQSGGKNATLIHSSADLQTAVKSVVMGAYKFAGQLCTSTSRVFVHKSLTKAFVTAFADAISQLPVGRTDTVDKNGPFMGPLYSRRAVDKFLQFQTMAGREARETISWGKTLSEDKTSCLVTPGARVMKSFDANSGYQSNVLFCPDVAIYEYEVLDEAIKQINLTDAPFVVSFIGEEKYLTERRGSFTAPNVLVNLPTVEVDANPVVAGKYKSGHHRFGGISLVNLLTYPSLTITSAASSVPFPTWLK